MSLPTPVKKMSSAFKTIISRSQSLFSTPSSSTTNLNGVTTAKDAKSLFPVVNPDADGEDCDRDCASCTIRYPSKFSINEDDELYGHVKGWSVHLLIATGKSDWVRDVADEKGSLMEALDRSGVKPKNGVCHRSRSIQNSPQRAFLLFIGDRRAQS
jgi:hypothetical protein